uniref:Macaca fascicularis brain cDNA, clone: QflA-16404 n=1 Tax=Macaca fascicularis TaxID=9541 RepID=I7GBC5_MACFA|nr:unnamed protein product [Macaca fascicularis]
MLPNNQKAKEEIKRKIKPFFETNVHGNMSYQTLQDTGKAVQRGQFITINAYMKKERISNEQPNHAPQETKRQEQSKPKIGRRKTIVKLRAEMNK